MIYSVSFPSFFALLLLSSCGGRYAVNISCLLGILYIYSSLFAHPHPLYSDFHNSVSRWPALVSASVPIFTFPPACLLCNKTVSRVTARWSFFSVFLTCRVTKGITLSSSSGLSSWGKLSEHQSKKYSRFKVFVSVLFKSDKYFLDKMYKIFLFDKRLFSKHFLCVMILESIKLNMDCLDLWHKGLSVFH